MKCFFFFFFFFAEAAWNKPPKPVRMAVIEVAFPKDTPPTAKSFLLATAAQADWSHHALSLTLGAAKPCHYRDLS
jgi:hypothetical protein